MNRKQRAHKAARREAHARGLRQPRRAGEGFAMAVVTSGPFEGWVIADGPRPESSRDLRRWVGFVPHQEKGS